MSHLFQKYCTDLISPTTPPLTGLCFTQNIQIRKTKQFLESTKPLLVGAQQKFPWISVDPGPVLAKLYCFRTKIGLWLGTMDFHRYLLISKPKQTVLTAKKHHSEQLDNSKLGNACSCRAHTVQCA